MKDVEMSNDKDLRAAENLCTSSDGKKMMRGPPPPTGGPKASPQAT